MIMIGIGKFNSYCMTGFYEAKFLGIIQYNMM